jgi:hypothetical protein
MQSLGDFIGNLSSGLSIKRLPLWFTCARVETDAYLSRPVIGDRLAILIFPLIDCPFMVPSALHCPTSFKLLYLLFKYLFHERPLLHFTLVFC